MMTAISLVLITVQIKEVHSKCAVNRDDQLLNWVETFSYLRYIYILFKIRQHIWAKNITKSEGEKKIIFSLHDSMPNIVSWYTRVLQDIG